MTIWSDLAKFEVSKSFSEIIALWGQINILVVTDSIVSFGSEHDPRNLNEDYFGMSHLISILDQVATVTKAHRTNDPLTAPGVVPNFRFDEHNLNNYHQIWLLGFATGILPDPERAAIADFMNKGGGVFATGDHAGLGSALAIGLPRVGSMRYWQSPPPSLGPDRIDTTRPDVNDVVVFENQSDDIPQILRLKLYQWSQHRWFREVYPHPLLCSASGSITEFPDHMHEGEVIVPNNLDAKMKIGGKTFDEYPKDKNGNRVSPEVVAWGWTTGRADPEVMHGIHTGDPGTSIPRWTGTIGVYDGHQANVGRVVVHSTWHHFFDINLIGDNAANRPEFNDPRAALWQKGFTASPNGLRILSQIDQYYKNIVHWLSPGVGRLLQFNALIVQLATSHHIREVVEINNASALPVGAYAWEYALRYYPPCMLIELTSIAIEEIPVPWGPWGGPDPGPDPGPDDAPMPHWPIPPKQLAQAALGGALLEFTQIESIDEIRHESGIERLRTGALEGVKALLNT
ncbi:MAG: hypothetical protein WCD18_19505, partial [Thermosynechococcaceae cyanobacterium]